ncbi:hypothetical protein PCANC_06368 [Puccinia coronata f. sp. avenae]|nr:hypothetical protein PCANC_06368 [Puccinia coronata f. sp. avenae]PLW46396.1 hypothetical protein PCASD_05456 [Puccinia coronata f. sp. avenae]
MSDLLRSGVLSQPARSLIRWMQSADESCRIICTPRAHFVKILAELPTSSRISQHIRCIRPPGSDLPAHLGIVGHVFLNHISSPFLAYPRSPPLIHQLPIPANLLLIDSLHRHLLHQSSTFSFFSTAKKDSADHSMVARERKKEMFCDSVELTS